MINAVGAGGCRGGRAAPPADPQQPAAAASQAPAQPTPAGAAKVAAPPVDGDLSDVDTLLRELDDQLTDGHQATLQGILDKDIAGLQALRTKVAAETTVDAVKADPRSMVADYRVYLLVGPQVRITIAADVATAAAARLRDVAGKLQQAIAAAKAAGKDVFAAEAKLAEMNRELDAVALAGVADTLLAVTPSPDAEAIKAATSAARAKVRAARMHLKAAVADARAIRDLLKK